MGDSLVGFESEAGSESDSVVGLGSTLLVGSVSEAMLSLQGNTSRL